MDEVEVEVEVREVIKEREASILVGMSWEASKLNSGNIDVELISLLV